MRRPTPETPGPGQESVWDYPRPPAVDPSSERVIVRFGGVVVADSTRTVRILETSHAPVYYLPPDDVDAAALEPIDRRTFCEFKGAAAYADVVAGGRRAAAAAWWYPDPTPRYRDLAGWVTFYPSKMDEVTVDGEVVQPVGGDFYGSWVTSRVVGPFKGGPGTQGW